MFEAELLNPCKSLTQKDPQLEPRHDVLCSWLCGTPAELCSFIPLTGRDISPLSGDLRYLWVAVVGARGRAGWAGDISE